MATFSASGISVLNWFSMAAICSNNSWGLPCVLVNPIFCFNGFMSIRDTVSFGSYFSNNCLIILHANPDGHSVVWALISIPIKLGESSAAVRLAKAMAFLFFAIFCFSAMFASVFKAAPSDSGRSGSSVWPTACLNFHTVAKAENRNHHVWKFLWLPAEHGQLHRLRAQLVVIVIHHDV